MTRTMSSTASKTVTIKKVKAKHFANQAGLDRLQELLVKASSNPKAGQHYAQCIKRAFKSVQECKEPILTQKNAVKLKFVGPAMAKKICPQSTGMEVAAAAKPKATTKRKPANKDRVDENEYENDNENDHPGTSIPAIGGTGLHPKNTGIPLVSPRPAIPSVSRCTSALESSFATSTAKEAAYVAAKADADNLVLPRRGPWKVILLVDNREHKSKQVVSSCKQAGIPCEERQLAIGDMAWIARCIVPNDASVLVSSAVASKKRKKDEDKYRTIEILVGTIIERKEVSDLASSLFGTRYAEQRLRLSQCGVPQVLFLVEGSLSSVDNCPADTLQMAMMETRINLGFQIVQTKHLTETVSVLKTMHSRIVQRTFPDAFGKPSTNHHSGQVVASQVLPTYGGGNKRMGGRGNRRASSLLELAFDTAPIPPFGSKRFITYPELKAKVEVDRERGTRSVRAITLAMLKQIPSLSQKKCTAIATRFPTMNRLMEAMAYPDPRNHTGSVLNRKQHPKKTVQDIEIDSGRRTIGPVSASEIYAACCTLRDGSTVDCHAQDTKPAATKTRITSFFPGAGSSDANNEIENRKLPPIAAATNTARPAAAAATKNEKAFPKKARKEYASASAKAAAARNVLLQFLNDSSDDSSPEKPPRAFSTRKRPAPIAANESRAFASPEAPTGGRNIQTSVNNRNPLRFDSASPPRNQQQEQQATVDLLTPEPSPKCKPTFAKSIRRTDLSDCSNSSNNTCDLPRNGSNKTGVSTNFLSKTGVIINVRSKSNINVAISNTTPTTIDTTKKATKMRAPAASDFLSPDEDDSPLPTTTASKNAIAKRNFATTDVGLATKQRTPAASDGGITLLLSSDEDDSPLPTTIATKNTLTNRNSYACAKGTSKPASARLESSSQSTPNDSQIGTKPARARWSLASSPGDGLLLFSSPDDSLLTYSHLDDARLSCEVNPPGRTNNSDKNSGIGTVCLLDDSDSDDDDEKCDELGKGIPHKGSKKPLSAPAAASAVAALPGFGTRMSFVTTTRGGALHSTQESACSDGGGSTSSEEELEVGTSLRERLGTIRGRNLREVIDLNTDSE